MVKARQHQFKWSEWSNSREDSYQSGEKDVGSTGHSIKNGVDELAWVYKVYSSGIIQIIQINLEILVIIYDDDYNDIGLPRYWSQAQLISSSAPTVEFAATTPTKSTWENLIMMIMMRTMMTVMQTMMLTMTMNMTMMMLMMMMLMMMMIIIAPQELWNWVRRKRPQ